MEISIHSATADRILDATERHMRNGGYDAVSFRDIAADVGIKSASVHYHFPQKSDLGEAVVRRYTDRFVADLAAPDDPSERAPDRIERLCRAYRAAVVDDGMICLCCVLGAETLDLPDQVADAVRAFFSRVLAWTETALAVVSDHADASAASAAPIIASLQGAMILAVATGRTELFDETAERVLAQTTE